MTRIPKIVKVAQELQEKREEYVEILQELPAPKVGPITFPYASMQAAIDDGFALLDGPEEAYRFMVKGFKTIIWRKAAGRNRDLRDELAEEKRAAEERKREELRRLGRDAMER